MTTEDSQTASLPSPLDIALKYIAGGINVTPVLSPRSGKADAGKAAYVMGWQKRRLTQEEFGKEFRKGSNIGVVTGASSGLVCLDLDGREGLAWYYEHQDTLPAHVVERRGAGGIHLYFRHPGGYVRSKLRLFPGVDVLADGGKQVVTWPSQHRSGDAYVIDNGLTLLDVAHEADEPPAWLLKELTQVSEPVSAPVAPVNLDTDQPHELRRCIEHLAHATPAVQGQGGDNRTVATANLCRDYGLSEAAAYEAMRDHWNDRCQPAWGHKELREKVAHAYKYNKAPAGSKTLAAAFPDDPEVPEAATDPLPPAAYYSVKRPVVSAQTYLARNENMTLCASNQLYRYAAADRCWQFIKDDQFKSVLMADIERADADVHRNLKMSLVGETASAVKRLLEGDSPDRELRADTWLDGRAGHFISCRNGILDLTTGEILPHTPAWFSFTSLSFDYDPDAACPEFHAFIDSVWEGDEDIKESLRLWIGYVLISSMKQQKFAVFKGASRAGKGTVVRVIEELVGQKNFVACSMNTFGGDFGMEPLLGKRLAIFNDAEKGSGKEGHISTERIKSITGNDSLPVNRKGCSILTMTLPTKIMLVCNKVPPFVNDENAMTNRMIGFPFEKSFVGREDRDLGDKLRAELPGIFNWAVVGARRLLRGDALVQSKAGAALVEEIAVSLDSVRCFFKEVVRFTPAEDARVSNDQLWDEYSKWCDTGNAAKKSRQGFFTIISPLLKEKAKAVSGLFRGYAGILLDVNGEFSAIDPDDDSDIPF